MMVVLLGLMFIVSFLLICLACVLEGSSFKGVYKQQYFECGFDSFNLARVPFSMQFFLIGMIFIMFDLEIVFLIFVFFPSPTPLYLILLGGFLGFLLLTWWVEWKISNLKWQY